LIEEKRWRIHLSMSHVKDTACAMVILETLEP
jgi:phosphopantetheinyl transferase (holo-ACP synthase)